MNRSSTPSGRQHILTVALEDYYHVGAFNRLIQRGRWYRFESRLEQSTLRTLALLDEFGVHCTFFGLGWVADEMPELIRVVTERGHEIASKGYYHRSIREMNPGQFRDDLARSREALQRASGQRVLGYRVADQWFRPEDLWALDILAAEGYEYDSSIAPILRRFSAEPWRRFAHTHQFGTRTLSELPISSAEIFGRSIPIAGGNYLRQLPHTLMRRAVDRWDRTCTAPLVMYFHVWELDPDQPRIGAAPLLTRIRQYRNLDRMPELLRYYLGRYRFTGIADHLGLSPALSNPAGALESQGPPVPSPSPARKRAGLPVTVVVPCYNEEQSLHYLANTLESVERDESGKYDFRFVFVDDRSTDGTWAVLQKVFGRSPNCSLLRHERNRGVAAAILTGLRHAETEIVASIDCDCSYDPHDLEPMIPLLVEGVDLVTASPYHPAGAVKNVSGWRLFLSKSLSAIYRRVLHHKLSTYTSCFRVYRRSAVLNVPTKEPGFLGIMETLGAMDLAGYRIVEYPTTLEVRMLGRSKMRVLRTVTGHGGLLLRLVSRRLFGRRRGSAASSSLHPAPRLPVAAASR